MLEKAISYNKTADYERIKHEIWSALGNAIPEKALRAEILPLGRNWRTRPGQPLTAEAEIINSGGAAWKNTSVTNRRHVTLGISLLDQNRNIINRDFARRILPQPLQPAKN